MNLEKRLQRLEEKVGIKIQESENLYELYYYDYMKNKFVLRVSQDKVKLVFLKTRMLHSLVSLINGNDRQKFLRNFNGTRQKEEAIREVILYCYDDSDNINQFKRKLEFELGLQFYLK